MSEFARGFFCAVATLLKEDGPTTSVRSLLRQGGDVMNADEDDFDLFLNTGLIDRNGKVLK